MDPLQTAAAIGSGVIVGFTLGLVGGGGSILALPLLLYVVGMPDPHLATALVPSRSRSMRSPISCRTRVSGMFAGIPHWSSRLPDWLAPSPARQSARRWMDAGCLSCLRC